MKALIIHRDLMPALSALPDAELGNLMRAAMNLVQHGLDEPPTNPAVASFAWSVLREKILETGQKYEDECRRRADHARRAAQARHGTTAVESALQFRQRA